MSARQPQETPHRPSSSHQTTRQPSSSTHSGHILSLPVAASRIPISSAHGGHRGSTIPRTYSRPSSLDSFTRVSSIQELGLGRPPARGSGLIQRDKQVPPPQNPIASDVGAFRFLILPPFVTPKLQDCLILLPIHHTHKPPHPRPMALRVTKISMSVLIPP